MIETRYLTKHYKDVVALDNLNMKIEKGQVYGFIGPNGAGKTTTIKVLSTLLKPTAGTASVCGYDVVRQGKLIRRHIGYMPDFFGVYEDMKVTEYLSFFAAAYRITGPERDARVRDILELTDLGDKRDAFVESLSRGMQQRLGVARVLLHDPEVLLLDEPASGLDPRARIEIRALLKELGKMGKTILISSHILTELAEMCSHVGIIEKGRLIAQGPIKEIMRQATRHNVIHVSLVNRSAEAVELLSRHEAVAQARQDDGGGIVIELNGKDSGPALVADLLVKNGFQIESIKRDEASLELAFMHLTKGIVS
ncbi:MAG: ABC transporter ATP-binding protein [Planctomycetota bacterium]